MQPHRYFNELDHWRTVAQRPHPSSPPLSPTMKSASSAAVETGKTSPAAAAAADPFAVEGSRGWLEYAPVSEAGTSSMTLATGAGTKTKDKRNNASSSSTAAAAAATSAANRTHGDSQQKKAVSNEDILNLTKMTAQLPDRTGGGNSNNNNNSKKYHHDHRNNKPAKKERTFASTEHLPSSVSTNNNNNSSSSSNNVYPSLTRPSLSTPSPSNRNKINNNSNSSSGSNNEHRRSWYKHFIKGRDKGKGRMDINETQQQQPTTTSSASMIRDGSHHSSSNNSALTTNTGSSIAAVGDPLKLFMSAHHHPMSVITTTTTSESSSEEGGNNKKFSTSSLIKLRSHRRTSSESPLNRAPSAATRVPKRRSSNLKFQRRHSLDSIRAPDDYDAAAAATVASAQAPGGSIHPPVPLFSTPEPISGEQTSNNNVLGSDLTHLDETDLSVAWDLKQQRVTTMITTNNQNNNNSSRSSKKM
ncbi:hypothetical protein BDB00DRAFT_430749 [Zychaea mexicana]|uniref:uncharacterized protein n=1 Tax=Zychaea mexicana TaxID=64656 RepID=UPI0022FEF397|nr:uncharacterized protein BDB00DRAFT_430749 [Zychaea mexicana]KAI9492569.1 hypothetical protein BDB00DRAFT_430749 [Zychaea mexicana]